MYLGNKNHSKTAEEKKRIAIIIKAFYIWDEVSPNVILSSHQKSIRDTFRVCPVFHLKYMWFSIILLF